LHWTSGQDSCKPNANEDEQPNRCLPEPQPVLALDFAGGMEQAIAIDVTWRWRQTSQTYFELSQIIYWFVGHDTFNLVRSSVRPAT
jgi:hypothetical protein